MKTPIYCNNCEELLGWDYEDTREDQGFFQPIDEGYELIEDENGRVFCSEFCREEENG